MLLLLEHTLLLLSPALVDTKVVLVLLGFRRHSVAANPVSEPVSGVLVTPSALDLLRKYLFDPFIPTISRIIY